MDDVEYRRERESYYIELYDATNPDKRYNSLRSNRTGNLRKNYSKENDGYPCAMGTKIMLSKPLLAYTRNTGAVMMYFGGKSYCNLHGLEDESMASLAVRNGQSLHGDFLYRLDVGDRLKYAIKALERRRKSYEKHQTIRALTALTDYLAGLYAVTNGALCSGLILYHPKHLTFKPNKNLKLQVT